MHMESCMLMLQGKTTRVWDIKHSQLYPSQPVENPLESDARNRKDVVYLKEVRRSSAFSASVYDLGLVLLIWLLMLQPWEVCSLMQHAAFQRNQ